MTAIYNPMSLVGKTILVTGASSGIGRAIAIECSRLGANCIITARNRRRLQETLSLMEGEGHSFIPADQTNHEAVQTLVEQLPKLDGVSHNAGIAFTMLTSFAKEETVEQLIQVNLISTIYLQTLLLKKRKINKKASLVFMSSLSALIGGNTPGNGFYAITKAGLINYAQTLANELRSKGIRSNCVCPGMVETPLISSETLEAESYREKDKMRYLHNRYGQPEEVAHLVAYLLSDAAMWISGSQYKIDGAYLT